MSEIIDTQLGRFRRVTDGERKWFLFECPTCKEWQQLSDAQMAGVDSMYCHGVFERREYGAALLATVQVAHLMGQPVYHEEASNQ